MTTDTNFSHATYPDIIQRSDSPFIVVGFFTPDYASAAMAFAKNLVEHRISHHLYARPNAEGDWFSQTRQKPSVLTAARKDYPEDVLVLMDIDCRIRGDINGILHSPGDVALRTKRTTAGRRYALKPCTRVMVLRPTAGSTAFVNAWQSACQSSRRGSAEAVLMLSMSDTPESYSVGTMPLRYAGMELHDAPSDALIVHDSIRDPTRPLWATRRRFQKYLRAGRDAAFRAITGKSYEDHFPKRSRGAASASDDARSQ